MVHVQFIDTSVFCNLLGVPGMNVDAEELQREFRKRLSAGIRFVLPITTVIETGNHIAHCKKGDRRGAAENFRNALEAAANEDPPWLIAETAWDSAFITELVSGNSTSTSLVEHFTHKTLGGGDLAILVERDRYAARGAWESVEVWTIDTRLAAYAGAARSR